MIFSRGNKLNASDLDNPVFVNSIDKSKNLSLYLLVPLYRVKLFGFRKND